MGSDEDPNGLGAMVRAVLDGLAGAGTEEVCARHGVAAADYARWREVFLAGGHEALARSADAQNAAGAPPAPPRPSTDMHPGRHLGTGVHPGVPAWLRQTRGEARAPVVVAIVAAMVLQSLLPDRLAIHPIWVLPALESAVLVALSVVNPVRMVRHNPAARAVGLGLVGLIVAANTFSGVRLVHAILSGHGAKDPVALFGSGTAIYLTNVVAFALLYWEFDRGGPVARAGAVDPHPDFLFPQMTEPQLTHPDWVPTFRTTSTSRSPTPPHSARRTPCR